MKDNSFSSVFFVFEFVFIFSGLNRFFVIYGSAVPKKINEGFLKSVLNLCSYFLATFFLFITKLCSFSLLFSCSIIFSPPLTVC